MSLSAFLLDVVTCPLPACGGTLRPHAAPSVLRCARCSGPYPVLGGIPILVPDPAGYLAAHHDAVLATLAEHRAMTRETLRLVDDFASASRPTPSRPFPPDSVNLGTGEKLTPPASDDVLTAFARFLALADRASLEDRLAAMLPDRAGTVVEVGPGIGRLSVRLRARAERLLLGDWSLRAVLAARSAARRGRGGEVSAIVCDAQSLPLRPRRARAIVAANVIDLLDQPAAFLEGAADALARHGALVVSTPAPDLGLRSTEPILSAMIAAAGLRVREEVDALPWVHAHGDRHYEVFFVQAVRADKP